MSKQHWISQFQGEVEKQLSILEKSQKSKGLITKTMFENFYGKMLNVDTDALILEATPQNPRAKAFLTMAMYLWEYEARLSFCINILCFILMSNGHDLYDDYKKRYVKYWDHVLFNRNSAFAMKPQVREAVGWLVYECDRYITLTWDRDAEPPTLRGGDPKASGLVLLKSDILEMKKID